MGKSQELYVRAKKIIPGGTQLLSKRPEQFLPDYWPAYYKKAKGCRVWDLDDKEYVDASYMGIGANTIGYADDEIDGAVKAVIDAGSMTTLNTPEEVALAERLIAIHPWADMARFARSGGEAMMVAVRIARAATGRDVVLFCGYHGWHDWYIAANLSSDSALDGQLLPGLKPAGVPRHLKDTSFPFNFNNKAEFQDLLLKYKDKIAAVVMEPIRNIEPEEGFWECVHTETGKNGIALIIDEVTAGWRLNLGGAHLLYNIKPDIAVFAKGMSNGYPMAAVIGKKKYMDAAQDSFISSTYWTERIGPAAALATIDKMERDKVQEHLVKIGKIVQDGWNTIAKKTGLSIHIGSIYPLSHFDFQDKDPLVLKTLFIQEMLGRGYLATNSFYCCFAHTEDVVRQYLGVVEEVFSLIKKSIDENTSAKLLKGPVCQSGFKRLN
ncbi:MAG: aminotransferase class III-fold pyridoxal phosphate-dependent enzyme [Chitinispirillales bacterium]|jgi:glutamate-1-semialdehyde aminotransferase|nr:aminotransferase class III-fold pyridoxal phosphate-dependent enzyme [Chitinispirillales bacterium]